MRAAFTGAPLILTRFRLCNYVTFMGLLSVAAEVIWGDNFGSVRNSNGSITVGRFEV